ncbi:MAG: methyltransferase domain-containing protein [Candidatus Pacebacteria bacterium]|nr:methyltransferase domain-containing protein [Candidatus Paceibacterota bacterium]
MDQNYAKYLLEKTRNDYNLIADDFSTTRSSIWPETQSLLDKYFFPGERVLDLGCGNGRYFEYLKEKRVNYSGVDSSEKLINIAKNKYPEADFKVADALNLPFPDDFFDKIVSIAVLHHIPSKGLRSQFFKEARRVLRPGGVLFLTVWNFRELKEFFIFLKFLVLKLFGSKLDFGDFLEPWGKKTVRYYHYFTKKELTGLAEKVNFKIKETGIIRNERGNRRNTFLVAQKPL